jgi:hypothetical protein
MEKDLKLFLNKYSISVCFFIGQIILRSNVAVVDREEQKLRGQFIL